MYWCVGLYVEIFLDYVGFWCILMVFWNVVVVGYLGDVYGVVFEDFF